MPVARLSSKPLLGLVALAAAVLAPAPARAFSPYLVVPDPAVAEASPAYRYANMTDAEAFAELDRRSILYSRVDVAPGVRAPIRLTGRLHGVYVHSALPPEQRVVSPFEILDARLALAFDDFCALLARHDIDEVVHFTMYRPNAAAPDHGPATEATTAPPRPPASAPLKRAATRPAKKKAAGPHPVPRVAHRDAAATVLHHTAWAPPGTRHPAGLAIDVGLLHRKSGRWINIRQDFHGRIGQKTCGEGAPQPESADARELRALVCEAAAIGIFTYVLTPDYDAAHVDHFHMEIKPGVRWFLYH